MSIKDSNFNLQISMNIQKSCDNLDYFGFTDLIRKKVNEDELNSKIKQVREVTNCNEEFAIVTLHDCNYNVEYAINKILTSECEAEGEWKTKKAKQKKIPSKEKDLDKTQEPMTKDKVANSQSINVEKEIENCDKKSSNQIKKDLNVLGKTFKNFNLTKRLNTNYIIHENRKVVTKPEINFILNGKWNGNTIIIENHKFSAMPVKDIIMLKTDKTVQYESNSLNNQSERKDQIEDSSIVFKTHCTTKPPPKVLCSLVAPVQIINKTVKHHSLPKFKFGDTDFSEDFKKPDLNFNPDSNKLISCESKFVDIEDNSIIKVGPPQKISNKEPNSSFSSNVFNPNQNFFNQNNYPMKAQSNLCNNAKTTDFNVKKSMEISEYPYMNVHQHPSAQNLPNCNSNIQSINTYNPSMSPKEINSNSKHHDLYINPSSIGYSQQPSHAKSTIYLVSNMVMNPMNAMYMTVNNPLPTSALSPPMAPIPSQYNIPQQPPPPVYFEEALQSDDLTTKNNLAIRQFNTNRQQFPRYKKNGNDHLPDDLSTMKVDFPKSNMKNLTNMSMNQNAMSKNIPFSYPLYISQASVPTPNNHSQLFLNNSINSNSFNPHHHHNPFSNNFQGPPPPPTAAATQESNNNEHVRKRNIQVQNGNYHGKTWS